MIKILDELTINQIAAGEVIERPLNIVKELVENSIDSNANRIIIEIENGGIDKIIVKDNGSGFLKDDLNYAFTPHATSKINKIEDLNNIYTFGFRGEALSSIALASKTTIVSKRREDNVAYKIVSDFGKISKITETSQNDGTKVTVEKIFDKIPARKKFLNKPNVEASKIYDLVEKLALSRKDISFKFVSNGKERFTTSGNNNLESVVYTLYGKEIVDNVINIDNAFDKVHIKGIVGKPQINKNNRNDEIFFINGRYVKNDLLYKSVENAYREYLMQHKYPFLILFIDIDGKFVDVNAHPQKLEVRISDEIDISLKLKNSILSALKQSVLIKIENIDDAYDIDNSENSFNDEDIENDTEIDIKDIKSLKQINDNKKLNNDFDNLFNLNSDDIKRLKNDNNQLDKSKKQNNFHQSNLYNYFNENQNNDYNNQISSYHKKKNYEYKGQLFDTYLIFEFNDKVIFVDQHAAHEKINYENFIDIINNNQIRTQKIMPIVITLNAIQYDSIKTNIQSFRELGFDIEFFGDKDIIVEGVPLNILDIADKQTILEMIDDFVNDKDVSNYDSIKYKIASISCKASIKGNQKITDIEAYNLVEKLFTLKNPYNCPHGRPTMIEMTKFDFDKKFKRII